MVSKCRNRASWVGQKTTYGFGHAKSCRNTCRFRGEGKEIILSGQEPMTENSVAGLSNGREEGERGRRLGQDSRGIGGARWVM